MATKTTGVNEAPELRFSPDEEAKLRAVHDDIRALERQHGFHPALAQAVELCTNELGKPWADKLSPEREAAIKELLAEAHAAGTVRLAVWDLLRLSTWLDHDQHAGMPAYQLMSLLNDAIIEYQLAPARGPDATFAGAEADADKKRAALGQGEQALPAKLGDKAPEGSVTLDKLAPKRRI
ncbi:MAG: hypothetical protein IT383_19280 [Deltaproteobacteria bacterium]|nr:hypothetical protein [Deltaproteobacteria bacterium]